MFLEIFSGKAGITLAMRRCGWLVLPPIDIVIEGEVLAKTNILDPGIMEKVQNWLQSGVVALVHFGTPCATLSRARKQGDGGPPPIRAEQFLDGIPGISEFDRKKVQMGTHFLDITLLLCKILAAHGGHWSIENPSSSMLWIMPQTIQLIQDSKAFIFPLDMCAFGSEHRKPTTFACSHACLAGIVRCCPGISSTHVHVPLQGTVVINGVEVFRTKLAQVYPQELCQLFAQHAASLRFKGIAQHCDALVDVPAVSTPLIKVTANDPLGLGFSDLDGAQFSLTFSMITPPNERKRQLGTPARFVPHRQAGSGSNAVRSGYQMKRGVVPPLFMTEVEPGEVARQALQFVHPFTLEFDLDEQLTANIEMVCKQPDKVNLLRSQSMEYWQQQALDLFAQSVAELDQVEDAPLRRLLRGVPVNQTPIMGEFFHVALWRAMAQAGSRKDQHLINEMLQGMNIVGDISRSFRWPALQKNEDTVPIALLLDRAWDI